MYLYPEIFIFLALIGCAAGLLAGLLGIGGGIITVPALLLTFYLLGVSSPYLMHVALGTSLGAMVFTSAFSALAHFRKKGVNWYFFRTIAPGIIIGAIFGALIADNLTSGKLQMICGFAECLVGFYFLFPQKSHGLEGDHQKPKSVVFLVPIGICIGAISSILGIGGGIITVPILVAFGVHFRNAISTSAVLGFLIASIGAISYLSLGLGKETVPGSIGYLYLPGFFIIGFFSSLMASFGAKLAYILPVNILRKVFAVVLIIIGFNMIFK